MNFITKFLLSLAAMLTLAYGAYAASQDNNIQVEVSQVESSELGTQDYGNENDGDYGDDYPDDRPNYQTCTVVARLSSYSSRNKAVLEQCVLKDRRGRTVRTCFVASTGGVNCH